jgi:nucleotide-binding universal stress UspA family protein
MKNQTNPSAQSPTIIVPTDFTSVGDTAIIHAASLAKLFNKTLTLFHVVETGVLTSDKAKESKEEDSAAKLAALAKKTSQQFGLEVNYLTKRGNIFETIGEVAAEIDAALVVMGTHGVKGLQHVVGSRALKVITHSNRPFVVVQNKPIRQHGYKNIVLPIDFSKETKQKLMWAVELSKVFKSTFHILADFESDEYAAKAVHNNIAYAENFLKKNGCEFTVTNAEKGESFTRQTIRFASSVDADLIIIMTNQEKDFGDFIIGPYEQNVIANDSQIPVMTLNPVDNMRIIGGFMFQ